MGSREGPGVNHYMYFMQWSTCVAPNGTLHYGSLVLSYLSGYVLTTGRHAADGSVLPIMEARCRRRRTKGKMLHSHMSPQHAIPNLTACSAYGGELKTTMHCDGFVGYVVK